MNKKLIWILAATFSLILGQSAFAMGCGEGLEKIVKSLNLTQDQKTKIQPVLEQLKTSMQNTASQMKDLRTQMNQQVMTDNMDQSAMDGLIDKKAKLIGDMMKAKTSARHEIYMTLDDKQKMKFKEIVTKTEDKVWSKMDSCHDQD